MSGTAFEKLRFQILNQEAKRKKTWGRLQMQKFMTHICHRPEWYLLKEPLNKLRSSQALHLVSKHLLQF